MTIKVDSKNLKEGLLGLVIALVEIIQEVLQKQAIGRIESGSLREEDAEKLGLAFINLNQAIKKIKEENDLTGTADRIRSDLDRLVSNSLTNLLNLEELKKEAVEYAK